MDDNTHMVPIDDLQFEKRADTLPADLVDRITLIHHAFRDYLSTTLDQTIDNFKYDTHPENEVRVWEHMASVMLTLKYQYGWPHEKLTAAVKVVLQLSTGPVQDNDLNDDDTQQVTTVWNNRDPR